MPKRILPFFAAALLIVSSNARSQSADWVESTLKSMTLEEKVGQLFIADMVAVYSHKSSPNLLLQQELIRKYHVGGFVLAGGVVTDIALVTNALQRASRVPLLINADLEAGLSFNTPYRWMRGRSAELPKYITGGGTVFPSQMAIGATGNVRFAYEMGKITGREARAVGIRWTNSPVADVNINPNNPIINTRSFGENPKAVGTMVEAYVRGLQEEKVIATLKHFPGHGDTEEDTHMKLPMLQFDRARLDSVELVPFRAGIHAGAKAVMTAHIAMPKIDAQKLPATLSPIILADLLRGRLGFRGIVVTDGMTMQGITDQFSADEAAIRAIEAGADAVLVPANFAEAYDGVLRAAMSGRISSARLDESVRRLLAAKAWLGLDRNRLVDVEGISSVVGSPESKAIGDSMFSAAITLLRNSRNVVPLAASARVHLISVTEDPDVYTGEALANVLRSHAGSVTVSKVWNGSCKDSADQVIAQARTSDVIVLGVYLSIGAWKGQLGFSDGLENLLKRISELNKPVVTIAFGDPYVLGKLPPTDGAIATYTGQREAEEAVGRALTGSAEIGGKLPVTIPGQFKRGDGIHLMPEHR